MQWQGLQGRRVHKWKLELVSKEGKVTEYLVDEDGWEQEGDYLIIEIGNKTMHKVTYYVPSLAHYTAIEVTE